MQFRRSEFRSIVKLSALLAPLLVAGLLAGVAACGSDGGGGDGGDDGVETELFPADYADSYVEVRDCRMSIEHSKQVRILADPAAMAAYDGREEEFPEGAVVLKEEYEYGDDCTSEILQWTVMVRAATGTADDKLGWLWEEVDAERNVLETDGTGCIDCHTDCGVPPDGYEGTCAVP